MVYLAITALEITDESNSIGEIHLLLNGHSVLYCRQKLVLVRQLSLWLEHFVLCISVFSCTVVVRVHLIHNDLE